MKKKLMTISLVIVIAMCMQVFAHGETITLNSTSSLQQETMSNDEKMSDKLLGEFSKVSANTVLTASIWMNDIDTSYSIKEALSEVDMTAEEWEEYMNGDPDIEVINKYIMAKRRSAASLYEKYNVQLGKDLFEEKEVVYTSKYAPMIVADITYDRAIQLSKSSKVTSLDYVEPVENEVEVKAIHTENEARSVTSGASIYDITRVTSAQNSYGWFGDGIKIGVVSLGFPCTTHFPSGYNVYALNGSFYTNNTCNSDSCCTADVISSIATDSEIYYGIINGNNETVNGLYGVIEQMLSNGIHIINLSLIGHKDTDYGTEEKWLDHIAYNHDVHLVVAAGQGEHTRCNVGAMSYNAITVGNIDCKGTLSYGDDVINTSSSYYADDLYANKPNIVAPGTNISTRISASKTSTDISAAQVTGVLALLCEQDYRLLTKQDAAKALLLSTVNFDSPHAYEQDEANYHIYGAGLLDAHGAMWANQYTRWAQGTISSSASYNNHTFAVSTSDTRVRLALTFIAKSTPINSGNHLGGVTTTGIADLDIQVFDPYGVQVDYSNSSWDNVEIVDFTPTVAGTYTLRVTRYSSPDATTYYAYAFR